MLPFLIYLTRFQVNLLVPKAKNKFRKLFKHKPLEDNMSKEELKKIKKEIESFLNSDERVLKIEYKGDDLNASKYYHKILFGNPVKFLFSVAAIGLCSFLPSSEFKNSIYRSLGMKIGKDVSIPWKVGFDVLAPQLITIDDGAIIGAGVKFFTHEATISGVRIGKISIGKKALVGLMSTIRSGVSIGDYAVVGACSFVNKNVGNYEFAGGVPIKKIKKLASPI